MNSSLHDLHSSIITLRPMLLKLADELTMNNDDAHDLVQDTIVEALSSDSSRIGLHNVHDWLSGILRNIFHNRLRRNHPLGISFDSTAAASQLNLAVHSSIMSPEGAMTLNHVTDALNTLDPENRMAFSMHLAGYKYIEIAERLKVPLGTVKSRIWTTRTRLQFLLSDYR